MLRNNANPTKTFYFNCKVIGLAVNTRKTKYVEIGGHRGMIANEHIKIASNSYDKVKILRLFIEKSKFDSRGNKM